jgi:geranylgeranyl diphosphate synthase type II
MKWNINTGILSGDAMLILATNILSNMNQWFMQLAKLFNKTALKYAKDNNGMLILKPS